MFVDKFHLNPKEYCRLEGSVSLPEVLFVSSPKEGGLFILDGDRILAVDHRYTCGLWVHNQSLYRSINHWNYQEVIRYDADGTKQTIISLDGCEVHDVRHYQGKLYTVSTGTNELIRIAEDGEILERRKYAGWGDSWHINCMDEWNGRLVLSAFGKFDRHRGWKDLSKGSGIVFDAFTEEVLWDGLNKPHTPRIDEHGNKYVCDSANHLLCVDPANGEKFDVQIPGFTRGLAIGKDYLYVGLSQPREKGSTEKLPAEIALVDRKSHQVCGKIKLPVTEIYEILVDSN
jgi:hypothetical protein